MADYSSKAPKAETLPKSERQAFYAWTARQGFTLRNSTDWEIVEQIWRERAGVSGPARAAAPAASEGSIPWLRLLPTVAVAIIVVGAVQLSISSRHMVATTAGSESMRALPMPADGPRLGLSVTSRSNLLDIRWNRELAAIATSDGGVVKITEEGITEAVPLDRAQLHDGYVAYGPKTNDVNIRLEVTSKNGATTTESVRSVALP
jgi:hypothetical protein